MRKLQFLFSSGLAVECPTTELGDDNDVASQFFYDFSDKHSPICRMN